MRNQHVFIMLILALLVTGCVSAPQSRELLASPSANLALRADLDHVPFYPQEKYQCGPAALAMSLAAAGVSVLPEQLVSKVYVPGKHGSYPQELFAATRSFSRYAQIMDPGLDILLTEVSAGNPVLVLQNLGLSLVPQWHFAVVTGYDLEKGILQLHSGTLENYRMPLDTFERTWTRADQWAMVVTDTGSLPATTSPLQVIATLGILEDKQANPEALATYYQAALNRWPENNDLLLGYGNLLFARGKPDEALAIYTRLIDEEPDNAPALNNLAYTLYQLGRYTEALPYASKATRIGGEFQDNFQETRDEILIAMASLASNQEMP